MVDGRVFNYFFYMLAQYGFIAQMVRAVGC